MIRESFNSLHFPSENLKKIDFQLDLNSARHHIKKVLESSINTCDCFLSFYPLAKNLRFVSSYYFNSIKRGQKPIISPRSRPGESEFWNKNTGGSWFPWLWTRYFRDNSNNIKSWENIFNPLQDFKEKRECIDESADLQKDMSLSDFVLYLACLEQTFSPSDSFKSLISPISSPLPKSELICGVQVRRGEIVPKSGSVEESWKGRPIFPLEKYAEGLDILCNSLGTKNVFISSDSDETLIWFQKNHPEFNYFFNNYNRELFIRYDGTPSNMHLETDLQSNPDLLKHYTESCIADLISLSSCHGYVGGMSYSEYGLCGWMLQMIYNQSITPYLNVEGELNLIEGPLKFLLL